MSQESQIPLTLPAEVGAALIDPQASRGQRYRLCEQHRDLQLRGSRKIRWVTRALEQVLKTTITPAMIARAEAYLAAEEKREADAHVAKVKAKAKRSHREHA